MPMTTGAAAGRRGRTVATLASDDLSVVVARDRPLSAARGKDTYLAAKYGRIAARRGPIKAIVALEHAILIAIWHMLTKGIRDEDLGGDFYTKRNPKRPRHGP